MNVGVSSVREAWTKACALLRERLCPVTYAQWVQPIVPLSLTDEHIALGVSDDFFADWLQNNYADVLLDALRTIVGRNVSLVFEAGHHLPAEELEAPLEAEKPSELQKADRIASNCLSRYSFSNFVVGEENRYAHAAALTAAHSPGVYNPLYIYGGTGLGKTHLLQAVAHEVLQARKNAIVEYVTCEEFLNLYVESLQQRRHSEFRNRFRGADVLLIDDVHHLANKVQLQEEFFNTFNTLYNGSKQIILTSDKQPSEIKGLEDRLVSRFESGVTTEITPPSMETRLAILRMKQEEHALKVDEDVLLFIASNITSSIRRVEGALLRLVVYSSAMANCKITVPVAEKILNSLIEEEVSTKKVSVENIQKTVAEHFKLHVHDLTGPKRPQYIAEPRMVAMLISRQLTQLSLPEIGQSFGGRNHATVIHAINAITKRAGANENLRRTISLLTRKIQE
ncbi:MAG: hypothetical protein A2X49_13315 [Lentisphaerae bacterium GWF2_52_8]|nr:MAG: hypothetical protein A2X49_13315 [Lentisphaerae bacterium GWF2_52_8]